MLPLPQDPSISSFSPPVLMRPSENVPKIEKFFQSLSESRPEFRSSKDGVTFPPIFKRLEQEMHSPEGQAAFARLEQEMHSPEGQATFARLEQEMNSPEGQTTFERLEQEMHHPEGQEVYARLEQEMNSPEGQATYAALKRQMTGERNENLPLTRSQKVGRAVKRFFQAIANFFRKLFCLPPKDFDQNHDMMMFNQMNNHQAEMNRYHQEQTHLATQGVIQQNMNMSVNDF